MNKKNNYFYVVKNDETINDIAFKIGKSAILILIKNNIIPNKIKSGKILIIN